MTDEIRPAYIRIADDLRRQIAETRTLRHGHRLTEAALAAHYRTSRPTLRKALALLAREGRLCSVPGSGTFVTDPDKVQELRHTRAGLRARSRSLGVVVPCITVSNYSGILRGVEDAARRAGYDVLLGNCDMDPGREAAYMERFAADGVSGLIVAAGYNSAQNPFYRQLGKLRLPFVLVDSQVPGVETDFVATDGHRGAYLGTRYLLEQGSRRIAFVSGEPSAAPERLEGYRAAVAEAGLAPDARLVRIGPHSAEHGRRAVVELLTSGHADGLMLAGERMLFGFLRAIRQLPSPPPGLRVASFGRPVPPWPSAPPMIFIEEPSREVGREAARLLLERIQRRDKPPMPFRKILLAPRLVDAAIMPAEEMLPPPATADGDQPNPGTAAALFTVP